MIDNSRLNDEAYALKVLIYMIDNYIDNDTDKIIGIKTISSLHGCIPGRIIWPIFKDVTLSSDDIKTIQDIISIYS
ncbi:hypothetical protein VR7878_02749 [Vibrio ruber DSM 16370]|uniref:Uncharacterized protein n=1 Tax=Vibrio ruber (strain DSM 16370 / JCM 11486 / BCRC 17186 / CECT 7878 / LMG 23124 / VR1) TaxID=1123498 RepID=A0A1R4LP29_VIBR1|nr:hypothetical protein [Vibrio ruber]SJN58275.1 hypothetical protein VR7878_02749 [Vibrio ruber DSM 16370]